MAQSDIETYTDGFDQVWAAALRAVENLGYRFGEVDKRSGTITFKTGFSWKSFGQQLTVQIAPDNKSETTVVISSSSGQLHDWGEGESNREAVLSEIDTELSPLEDEPHAIEAVAEQPPPIWEGRPTSSRGQRDEPPPRGAGPTRTPDILSAEDSPPSKGSSGGSCLAWIGGFGAVLAAIIVVFVVVGSGG